MTTAIKGPIELGIEAELLRSELNAEQVEGATKTTDALFEAKQDFHKEAAHIATDERLSDAGRKLHTAQLRESMANRYHQITDERLKGLDSRIAELEYQTRPQAPDTDPTRELMRQQEVRRMLEGRDELALIEQYLSLAVSGENDLWMRSVEQSPIPLITDPAITENGKQARGLRESPEAALMLRQLRIVRATIQSTLDAALIELNIPDTTIETIASEGLSSADATS